MLDTSLTEESMERGSVLLAMMHSRNEVTQICAEGEWGDGFRTTIDLAMSCCQQLDGVMRSFIKDSVMESTE